MNPIDAPPPHGRKPKKRKPKSRRLCDCGRPALYKQRVTLFRADLDTEIHTTLYLCGTCLLLECDLHLGRGDEPPAATRIG